MAKRLSSRPLSVLLAANKEKGSEFTPLDDLDAPPGEMTSARIRQAFAKNSSWDEIGPVGNQDPGSRDPMRSVQFKGGGFTKKAEPPPPPGVSAKLWDKILESKSRTELIKDKAAAMEKKALLIDRDPQSVDDTRRMIHRLKTFRRPGSMSLIMLSRAARGRDLETGRTKQAYVLQGHTKVQDIPISIENRKGSVRKGTDSDGKEWRTKMKFPYGYITGSKGADGEPVDVYVGPDKEAPSAFVVHQRDKETGEYDEDKVMLGFRTKAEARAAFLAHYNSPKFLGPIHKVEVDRLRELVASKRKLVKIAGRLVPR